MTCKNKRRFNLIIDLPNLMFVSPKSLLQGQEVDLRAFLQLNVRQTTETLIGQEIGGTQAVLQAVAQPDSALQGQDNKLFDDLGIRIILTPNNLSIGHSVSLATVLERPAILNDIYALTLSEIYNETLNEFKINAS
ncbi:hypothetical protein FACS189490_02010 [Clostridia bacterium]|nr:hypothetical protein FACS189490_02010 [Clostridia bacterium]